MSEAERQEVGAPAEIAATSLVVRRTVRAEIDRVFAAWTEPASLREWWGPEPITCPVAEVDLRVGGRYRLANRYADGSIVWILGEFERVEPPHMLVYTWSLEPGPPMSSRVTVRFDSRGDDVTDVTVTHERLPDAAMRDMHEQGWNGCLAGLAAYLEGAQKTTAQEEIMELERDEFGTTTFDSVSGFLELAWTGATERMTDAQFRAALERFAAHAVTQRAPNVLIDVTRFAHKMSPEAGPWRDEHVIPLYNRAGVKKMAFLVPAGAPGTVESGAIATAEPPGNFPTGYSAHARPCSTGLPRRKAAQPSILNNRIAFPPYISSRWASERPGTEAIARTGSTSLMS